MTSQILKTLFDYIYSMHWILNAISFGCTSFFGCSYEYNIFQRKRKHFKTGQLRIILIERLRYQGISLFRMNHEWRILRPSIPVNNSNKHLELVVISMKSSTICSFFLPWGIPSLLVQTLTHHRYHRWSSDDEALAKNWSDPECAISRYLWLLNFQRSKVFVVQTHGII